MRILLLVLLVACGANPAAGVYGAERSKCVDDNDKADDARACMKHVDEKYGQDGGLK